MKGINMNIKILTICAALLIMAAPAFADVAKAVHMNSPTVTQACTTSSASEAYGNTTTPDIIVSNTGSVGVFISSGASDVVSYASAPSGQNYVPSAYVAAGSIQRFSRNASDTHIACITASSSATIFVQSGSGE